MSNIKKLKHPYGYVANSIINDKTLSYNAKGIYLYILSKPDEWDFSHKRIAQDSITSEYSVRKAIKELEDANLLTRTKLSNGRVMYQVTDPVQEKVTTKTRSSFSEQSQKMNTQTANPQVAKDGGISKKEYKVIKNKSNTDTSNEVAMVIKLFEKLDPKNRTYYGNKTQRAKAKFLLEEHGIDKIEKLIDVYLKFKGDRFLPSISSPYEMVEKWSKLADFFQRKQSEQNELVDKWIF